MIRIDFLFDTYNLFSYLKKLSTSIIYLNFETFDFCACVVKILKQFHCINASKICNVLMNSKIFFKFFSYEFSSTNNAVTAIRKIYCFIRSLIKITHFDFIDSSNKMKIWFSISFFVESIVWFWRDVIVAFIVHTKTIVWNIVDEKKFCSFFTHMTFKFTIFFLIFSNIINLCCKIKSSRYIFVFTFS